MADQNPQFIITKEMLQKSKKAYVQMDPGEQLKVFVRYIFFKRLRILKKRWLIYRPSGLKHVSFQFISRRQLRDGVDERIQESRESCPLSRQETERCLLF